MAKAACKNCGDPTNFSGDNVDPKREKLGWCVNCFKHYNAESGREMRSCAGCGKDTGSASGYCAKCIGPSNSRTTNEYRDRTALSPQTSGHLPND